MKRLALWEIRASLAAKRFDKVTQLLKDYETAHGRDFIAHHMRGVMLLKQGTAVSSAQKAATEFQQALKLRRNWESMQALGIALLRGGKAATVGALVRDLEKRIKTDSQRYWADMLKAEWYVSTGKAPLADAILTGWVKKAPAYLTPHVLLVDLYRKMGKTSEAVRVEAQLNELALRPKPETLAEKFGSPLHVLALERRPLD